MERLIEQNAKAADYNSAMHAASARNMGNMLMRLFMIGADYTQLDRNNWSLMDTATEYDAISILQLLPTFLEARHQDLQSTVEFERPTSWNKRDMHRQVEISDDGLRMKLKGPVRAAMGRSNFCMPTRTPLYYFEVTIEKLVPRDGNTKPLELGVGFCEEHVALDSMVGWRHGSWGHHLDDGCLYSESGTGKPDPSYTEQYAEGDTIGCGINFRDRTAFFTKNGTFLGNVFSGIRGKLYPAVSFGRNLASDSCIVANFGGDPAVKFKYNPPVSPPDSTSLDLEPAPTRSKATKTKKKSKKFKRTNSLRHDDEA
ncbi:concanavalin A-like lectin/glucanase domain-containing protein [Xylaria telfairii]|nr:concanavalin A-like lectin/glucanase domain-containing protein [Xylaria telfairii]